MNNKLQKELLLYKEILENNIDTVRIVSIEGIDKKHDKTFKNILSEVQEMSSFLSQCVGLEVKEENLEKYKNSFITKRYQNKESDIIYRQKDKEIYYLIEHQSTVDSNMPNRILSYCEELLEEIRKGKKIKKENPIIVPIVIYSGNKRWTVATNFSETQKTEENFEEYKINLKYKLIDISEFSKKELLEQNTKFSSIMLIEKCETSNAIRNVLIDLICKADKNRINWIKEIIKYVLQEQLEKEDKELIYKFIERKEGNDMDDEWFERVKRNNKKIKEGLIKQGKIEGRKEGIKEGIKETIIEVIKNMLQLNQDEEIIMKCTNAKKEEIEKIKEELKIQAN